MEKTFQFSKWQWATMRISGPPGAERFVAVSNIPSGDSYMHADNEVYVSLLVVLVGRTNLFLFPIQ